ncbi:uncharacterized protein LOC115629056 [Scaptodrosophila lebanonensis]|uniref:Uncharacterized protein LOC115629056 n=1 Tax=Drosophila lebanonensis TaxID=7225 RepID=A0A6J2U199_DROLE|nr:uncharacterized protein LOC115629056 [Scaptodrosophila lebanonensis]
MSVRALKKRDTQLLQSSSAPRIFKKASSATITSPKRIAKSSPKGNKLTAQTTINRQRNLLGRATHSNPELSHTYIYSEFHRAIEANNLLRSKSEGDVRTLALENNNARILSGVNAKSEVCLQSITSHSYETAHPHPHPSTMLGGARSHRDLTQSSYATAHGSELDHGRAPRRMSECSMGYSQTSGGYSQRTSTMFASQMTLSSSAPPVDPNAVLRVPIVGYEVMEERARFTVYKLRVENPATNDCWLVMRRYTDFVRLNTKLKQAFPNIVLQLPRKKLFGDNFNAVFLDNRVQGLQIFVNSIMAKEELRKCKLVREFFCLDEPPSYSESMEECRAIFEAQEETIAHLKLQIQSKNDLILSLQQKLREELAEKEQLNGAMKAMNVKCSQCSSASNNKTLQ